MVASLCICQGRSQRNAVRARFPLLATPASATRCGPCGHSVEQEESLPAQSVSGLVFGRLARKQWCACCCKPQKCVSYGMRHGISCRLAAHRAAGSWRRSFHRGRLGDGLSAAHIASPSSFKGLCGEDHGSVFGRASAEFRLIRRSGPARHFACSIDVRAMCRERCIACVRPDESRQTCACQASKPGWYLRDGQLMPDLSTALSFELPDPG